MRQTASLRLLLAFVLALLAAAPGVLKADDGDSPETLLEQQLAREAELAPSADGASRAERRDAPTLGPGPLFIGVDDVTVPTYRLEVPSGTATQAFLGEEVWGSAYDAINDRVLFNSGSTLLEWPVGGVPNVLGTIVDGGGAAQSMVSLAWHDGTLYGTKNIANEAIWIIDPVSLVATVFIDYVDADLDCGGLGIDQSTGFFYCTNDDATPYGRSLVIINPDASVTVVAPYPAGQTDIDGLTVGGGSAYLVTDEPGDIYVWDIAGAAYTTPIPNPWTTAEVFSGAAWIEPAGPGPQTFCSTPGVAIPDNDPTGVTDTLVIPSGGSLSDLDLTLDVSHTWVGDVTLTLTHVDTGTTITPFDRPGVPASTFGCSGDDVLATVNDEGVDGDLENTCIAGVPTIAGDLVGGDPPSATLFGAFDGEDFAGTWTLTATDAAGGDTGTLNEWCLVGTASGPAGPAITLDKTVGTDPMTCATTDSIVVPPGTLVTYCYTVTNTGGVTLDTHDLVDDQLGAILTAFPFPLDPGVSVAVLVPDVPIPATVTNTATWTASGPGAPVSVSACSGGPIEIPAAPGDVGPANPYPVTVSIAGGPASISTLTLDMVGISHTFPSDIDMLLEGPGGQTLIFMSDQGGGTDIVGLNITVDDAAATPFPNPIVAGTYQPTNTGANDPFDAPAPPGPYGNAAPAGTDTLTSIFGGTDANGTWNLWIDDDVGGDSGNMVDFCVNVDGTGPGASAEATDTATVTVLANPDIVVDPTSLSSFQEVDTTVDLPLDISNVGDSDLIWDITEDAGLQRAIVRVPGREKMLRPNRPSVRPEANEVKSGSQTFSRAEVTGEARTVTPQRGEVPDATVTITHSVTQNIVTGNSVSCNAGGLHTDNSYIREFDLAGFGISGQFAVTQVDVGIEQAAGAGGTQPVDVNLYLWNPADPFTFANFVPIGGASATVPDQALTIVTIPVSGVAPAGSHLVVEFFTPNGQTAGNSLFVGSNPDGQTAPTYLAAADCGVPEPLDTAVIGFPNMHLVMNVTGTTGCDADLPWVSTNPSSGTTVAGGTDTVTVTFDSTGLMPGEVLTGALCVNSNDPDTPELQVPLTLEVDTMPFLDGFESGDTSRWSFTTP